MRLPRTLRAATAALVLALAASVGGAADVSSAQSQLVADLRSRVMTIGSPAATPALAKEAKALEKAAAKLETFAGPLDTTTVAQMIPAFKQIVKSKTADAALLDSIADFVAAVSGCLSDEAVAAALRIQDIFVIADQLKAQNKLVSAREALDAALLAVQEDAVGNFDELAEAAARVAAAVRFINKTVERLETQLIPRIQYPLTVQNANGKPFKVTSIVFDFFVTPSGGGDPIRVTADWNDVRTDVSGPALPFTFSGQFSTFDLYPTFLEAVAESGIGNITGATVRGSMRFVSLRFGTVDVPIDLIVE